MLDLGFDILFKGNNFTRLLIGALSALKISLQSIVISLVFGTLFGVMRQKSGTILKIILRCYLEIMRIMPQMVMLFIFYFGASRAFGLNMSAEAASIIVFSLWGSAEMSDLVKGAMDNIPRHQYESALALGLPSREIYLRVIIPQIVRRLIPLSINLTTRLIKTTSLLVMIGVVEVLKVAQQIIEASRMTSKNAAFGVYLIVMLIYFLMCWPIGLLSKKLEKKWS